MISVQNYARSRMKSGGQRQCFWCVICLCWPCFLYVAFSSLFTCTQCHRCSGCDDVQRSSQRRRSTARQPWWEMALHRGTTDAVYRLVR